MTRQEQTERTKAIVKAVKDGEPPYAVAKRFNVSICKVIADVRKSGFVGNLGKKRESNESVRKEVANLLRGGMSVVVAGRRLGVSQDFVRDVALEERITIYRTVEGNFRSTWRIIAALIQQPESNYEAIGKREGVTRQRVEQIFKKARSYGIRFPGRAYIARVVETDDGLTAYAAENSGLSGAGSNGHR